MLLFHNATDWEIYKEQRFMSNRSDMGTIKGLVLGRASGHITHGGYGVVEAR